MNPSRYASSCGLLASLLGSALLLGATVQAGKAADSDAPFGNGRSSASWLESNPTQEECTIAVISGSATADHRPLLWKNRDAAYIDNEIVYFADGAHRYLALVSAGETDKAWIGVNDAGFAVLNALSHNIPDGYSGGITNGAMMKLALQTCVSVADFQNLLVQTNGTGRDNPANLAVIDAQGAAAMFEVGNFSFVRYDANDPSKAPGGFVVRANLSLSADTTGWDTWRYRRALRLVSMAVSSGGAKITDLASTARDLASVLVNPYPLPYRAAPPGYPDAIGYVPTNETINRRSTVASGIIQGVLPSEDPLLSTFYALLGQPVVAPIVPLWVAAGPTPPEVDGPTTAPLCDLTKQSMLACYDYPMNGSLLNTRRLIDPLSSRTQYSGLCARIERVLLSQVEMDLNRWRRDGVDGGVMAKAEADLVHSVYKEYLDGVPGPGNRQPDFVLKCSPNPMRLETGITIELTDGGSAHSSIAPPGIDIYDLAGRRLRAIDPRAGRSSAVGPYGAIEVRWDGRNSRGEAVPSGIYFCRARGSGWTSATPLIVIK